MGTVPDNPEDCGGAFLISLELAAFLGWHSWREEGGRQRGWGCGGQRVGGWEKVFGRGETVITPYIYLKPRLTRPQSALAATSPFHVTRDTVP